MKILTQYTILIFLNFVLLFPFTAKAETIIIPIGDLVYEIPNYEGPSFNLGSASTGQYAIGEIKKQKRNKKQIEKKLIDIAWTYFPDAESIKIYKDNFIIKCPDT